MDAFLAAALILAMTGAMAAGFFALARRNAPLEIWTLLRRRGIGVAEATESPRDFALALRRCALCARVDACNKWLASGTRDGHEEFCPNTAFFHRLEQR
jgi:hypothetical protein